MAKRRGLFDAEIISAGTLMGRMGKAEEAAKVLVLLLSDYVSFVTGGESRFHIYSVSPKLITD